MKTTICGFVLCALIATSVCRAEIISVALNRNFASGMGAMVFGTYVSGNSPSFPTTLTSTLDTVADTGFISSGNFGASSASTQSAQRSFSIPPTDFPDPGIVQTYIETITVDPIVLPIQFLSGTTGPITFQNGYRFPSSVSFLFQDSFTVSGTYKVQGPTETVTVPFSTVYQRTSASGVANGNTLNLILLGTSFPETARVFQLQTGRLTAAYTPATSNIFNGVVDGRTFRANLQSTVAAI